SRARLRRLGPADQLFPQLDRRPRRQPVPLLVHAGLSRRRDLPVRAVLEPAGRRAARHPRPPPPALRGDDRMDAHALAAGLEEFIAHEVADKAIPSISYAVVDRDALLATGH